MNIKSNNFFADQAFEQLGGEKGFDAYIQNLLDEMFPNYEEVRVSFSSEETSMRCTLVQARYKRNGSRVDNYASCAIIVRLVQRLDEKMQEFGHLIQNIVAVPGVDAGTFELVYVAQELLEELSRKQGHYFTLQRFRVRLILNQGSLLWNLSSIKRFEI